MDGEIRNQDMTLQSYITATFVMDVMQSMPTPHVVRALTDQAASLHLRGLRMATEVPRLAVWLNLLPLSSSAREIMSQPRV